VGNKERGINERSRIGGEDSRFQDLIYIISFLHSLKWREVK
jgi:hypothetical protein